jgi:hypothetical protein
MLLGRCPYSEVLELLRGAIFPLYDLKGEQRTEEPVVLFPDPFDYLRINTVFCVSRG